MKPMVKQWWKRQRRTGARDKLVERAENRIVFTDRVNGRAHREFMWALHDARERGFEDVVLDFSECSGAFPNGMIPLLLSTDALRRQGVGVEIVLPEDRDVERLFLNANWAHYLDPDSHGLSDTTHDRHVATHRFTTPDEQQSLVNAFMDVVLRTMSLERDVIAGLEWSINEITDNVLNHAQSDRGGLVQVSTFKERGRVAFAVGDSGRGILGSLREGYPLLRTDAQAIGEAVKAGVTRNPDAGQGNGLAGTLRIATMSGGTFEIGSGLAYLTVQGADSRRYDRKAPQRIDGTIVYAEIGLDANFHLADALGFSGKPYQTVDIIDLKYQTDQGDATRLRLSEESTGFGSRPAGRQLRTKCLNLLNAEPEKPLILDWTGVPVISSSFADELIGKLFVQLGPLAFSARVRNVALESLVHGLIDKAVMQRAAQASQFGAVPDVEALPELGTDDLG